MLCGTIPSAGDGVKPSPDGKAFKRIKAARTDDEERQAFEHGFFLQSSKRSREAGRLAWERIAGSRRDSGEVRCEPVPPGPAHKQALAFVRFMDKKHASEGSYDRFQQLRLPVLIANGESSCAPLMPSPYPCAPLLCPSTPPISESRGTPGQCVEEPSGHCAIQERFGCQHAANSLYHP